MNTEQSKMMASIEEVETFINSPRFEGVRRLYNARQIAEQQGTIFHDYSIAKTAANGFFKRLRTLFAEKKSITTFGPYSPGQAVMMKRAGIEGIYLGGWATSAKGSSDEDPGADLASYPLSQVPNEAASIVRALIAADKNQTYSRFNMKDADLVDAPVHDFSPYIIADADTGHGGDAQIRNLIRRFVEAGVPGYHIEDQKPGTKKCGHQGGKVLVGCDEQIKRLNAARFQLDIMRVEGIIVARTDAEAATLIERVSDERDQPFVLGVTNLSIPSYKEVVLTLHSILNSKRVSTHGHLLYQEQLVTARAKEWMIEQGIVGLIDDRLGELLSSEVAVFEATLDQLMAELVSKWESAAGVKTQSEAAVDLIELGLKEGTVSGLETNWRNQLLGMSFKEVENYLSKLGLDLSWDCELMCTPEGYYQVRGGIPFAIAKSLAVAPFADILWMETKTADLEDAKIFADAIHQVYPKKMLAYNLSPSFNWDSTGMTEEEMMGFPEELARMGFVFNFITYGGHQIDGLASEEFSNSLNSEGMLALAKVQRKLRMLESPYKTPQSHVGGSRLDGALAASSGRTATTKAMGKGSTQFQHKLHVELPTSLLGDWVEEWARINEVEGAFKVMMRPVGGGSSVLELSINRNDEKVANIIFSTMVDRFKSSILSVRDQNTFVGEYRRKRLMTIMHLFLLNRFKSNAIHYLTPSKDNLKQCEAMQRRGIYKNVKEEIGHLIVADVNVTEVSEYKSNNALIEDLLFEKADRHVML